MFLMVFAILLVMWLLGFFAFHVAGGLIHLLLIIAVISLLVHFFRGSITSRKTPRRRRFAVRSRKNRSTMLSHEALVGVKWMWNRGWRFNQRWTAGCLWVA
jgi:hypothetical protein